MASVGPLGWPRGVGRTFQRDQRGWEALEKGREGSGGFTEGTKGVKRPFWRAGRGREAILEVREKSGGHP